MSSSVAVAPTGGVAAAPTGTEAPSSSSSSSKVKGLVVALVTVLTLAAGAVFVYSQWWAPRQAAEQAAKAKYSACLDEVKAYEGTDSYAARAGQCASLYAG